MGKPKRIVPINDEVQLPRLMKLFSDTSCGHKFDPSSSSDAAANDYIESFINLANRMNVADDLEMRR